MERNPIEKQTQKILQDLTILIYSAQKVHKNFLFEAISWSCRYLKN